DDLGARGRQQDSVRHDRDRRRAGSGGAAAAVGPPSRSGVNLITLQRARGRYPLAASMRLLVTTILALVALLHAAGVQAQASCDIPPAPPPSLSRHGMVTVIPATGTIMMTNTGQASGRQP